jgi:hypothetical protein
MKFSSLLNKKRFSVCATGLVLGASAYFPNAAKAQALSSYFDFTQDGNVGAGGTVTSQYGNTSGILSAANTTVSGSGLVIASGGTVANTGLVLNSGSLSAYTGSFSLEINYTLPAQAGGNSGLFGGVAGAQSGNLNGAQTLFAAFNNPGGTPALRPVTTGGSFGDTNPTPANGTGNAVGTREDYVITFGGGMFTTYLNGAQLGTETNANFTSLADVGNFSIGGVAASPFGDAAVANTTTSFLFYTGALTAPQVATIDGFGSEPTLAQISSSGVGVVPEPSSLAAMGVCAAGLAAFGLRRRLA